MTPQQAQSTRRVAAFSISGQFLTDMAREHLTNGEPQRALHFLLDSLEGLSVDQATSLLQGRTRLTGNSSTQDIELVDEDPSDPDLQRYLEHTQRMWRGIFRFENKLYRPYARVTTWNRDDYHFSLQVARGEHPHVHTVGNEKLKLIRSAYYAQDPAKDLVVGTAGSLGAIYLCSRVDEEPPFWVRIRTEDPVRYLPDYEREHGLVETGADLSSRFDDTPRSFSAKAEEALPEKSPEELQREVLAYEEQLRQYFERILEQADAGAGYLDLTVTPEGARSSRLLKVPKAPFMHWVFRGVDCERLGIALPEWTPVCPRGLKMGGDDPHHSDWMLGAGLDLEDDYGVGNPVQSAAFSLLHELRTQHLKTNCSVLTGKGQAFGTVVFPQPGERVSAGSIAVIPHAGPQYQAALESACVNGHGALICETGGRLAHLVLVGRERDARIVMQPGALARYAEGDSLMVDCDAHSIEVSPLG